MTERVEHKSHNQNERNNEALERQAQERKEQLREQVERRAEASREHGPERASREAEREAKELARATEKERSHTEKRAVSAGKHPERLVRTKKTLNASFDREMKSVRSEMSTPSRTFSNVIHNKTVERVSEAAGKTVARPNAILAGSTFALIFTAALYFWAKEAGYALSGFETIAAFIIGWLCGIIFDFVRIAITGKS